MNIKPTILDDINMDVRAMLESAAEAHVSTGRTATVTLKLTVKLDRETQKREVRARVIATIPEGDSDSHTRKGDPALLLSVADDHPGQQKIPTE